MDSQLPYKPHLPEEFTFEGMAMSESMTPRKTLENIQAGQGPEYEVLVATYPRSGTLRLLEIIWLILPDCDLDTVQSTDVMQRYFFFDMCDPSFTSCYKGLMNPIPSPLKVAKTHLNYHIMKKHVARGQKIVAGLRNPKDVLVSLYLYLSKHLWYGPPKMTFSEFFEIFKQGKLQWGDVFDIALSWWNERHRGNILFVKYENMTRDPINEIRRIAQFLGHDLPQEKLEKISWWTTFSNMKKESSVNSSAVVGTILQDSDTYMRKGQTGSWKSVMNEKQSQFIDDKYQNMCLPLELYFTFD